MTSENHNIKLLSAKLICSQNFFTVFFNLYFQCKMDNKLCIYNLNNCADLIPYKAKFNFCDLTVVSGDLSELKR